MRKFTVYFVRHGLTTSNEKGLLRGSAGALVSEAGRSERKELKRLYSCPEADHLYASPSIRCRETAAILYPRMEPEDSPHFQANTNRHMASNNDWRDSA